MLRQPACISSSRHLLPLLLNEPLPGSMLNPPHSVLSLAHSSVADAHACKPRLSPAVAWHLATPQLQRSASDALRAEQAVQQSGDAGGAAGAAGVQPPAGRWGAFRAGSAHPVSGHHSAACTGKALAEHPASLSGLTALLSCPLQAAMGLAAGIFRCSTIGAMGKGQLAGICRLLQFISSSRLASVSQVWQTGAALTGMSMIPIQRSRSPQAQRSSALLECALGPAAASFLLSNVFAVPCWSQHAACST